MGWGAVGGYSWRSDFFRDEMMVVKMWWWVNALKEVRMVRVPVAMMFFLWNGVTLWVC